MLTVRRASQISYYGPTSAIHYPPVLGAPSPQHPVFDKPSSKSNIRTLLISNAEESRTWEEFALGSASAQINIPGGILTKLLHIHWTWVSPMFMWVYRPAFMRDMAIGGAYYSPFLLTVLCAHAARFHDARVEAMLTARVRLMLGEEIQKPSSIPTVQALLQLSAREMAFGSTSQAWLFSGMAFRMVSDLGLHHNSGHILSLGYLGPEDLEIRRRLFWSCYFWDKNVVGAFRTMSLYLGRMPALTELPFDHTPELLDDFAENEIWSPHYQDVNLSNVPVGGYPEMRAHSVSCFENSCKIAVILNDIICQLYARRRVVDIEQASRCIRSSLDEWRDKSPPHLKYDPDNLPEACPPPHILTQNLLYYTTIILLHRPFYSAPAHHAACRRAAHSLEKLLLLLERTFGFDRVTYLMGYCIYTGASVLIHDVKTGDVDAGRKMETFLRALRHSSTTMPVLQRSLSIINNCLEMGVSTYAPGSSSNNGSSISGSSGSEPPVESSSDALATMTGNYLPAFPYLDLHVGAEAGGSAMDLSGMNLDGFSLLDSFPENHISTTTAEWYHLP
ncbi:hypothetical protein VTK73DRAFT_2736 [Phialemonium thermophilum]|uniref:Xylanolytic transcriptional activator regulatory domain-containing protein n=1 Tax=Phialemonium thermophilum TaxID=223376 RepID=A0ABR3VPC4_9PEZI